MRFSPAVSILCAVIYSFYTASRESLSIFDGLFLFFVMVNNIDVIGLMLKRLLKLNIFIIFIVFFILAAHADTSSALHVFLRANLIIGVNIALFIKFMPEDFYYGFHSLRLPDRFTVLLFLCIKYIDILGREYRKMREALKVRGFKAGTNLFTYRTLAYTAGMLFVRSMDRAVKLSESMTLRGFKGRLYPFNAVSWRPVDALMVSMLIIQIALTAGGAF